MECLDVRYGHTEPGAETIEWSRFVDPHRHPGEATFKAHDENSDPGVLVVDAALQGASRESRCAPMPSVLSLLLQVATSK